MNWIGWLNKKRIFGINKNLKNSYWIRDNERKSSLWPRLLIDGRIETICGGVAFNHLSMSLRPLPFVFCLSILSIYLFIFKNDFISTGFYVVNIHPLRRALTNTHNFVYPLGWYQSSLPESIDEYFYFYKKKNQIKELRRELNRDYGEKIWIKDAAICVIRVNIFIDSIHLSRPSSWRRFVH